MYRPADWDEIMNKLIVWPKEKIVCACVGFPLCRDARCPVIQRHLIEAGVNAMLEILKEKGMRLRNPDGWTVFIPDEEEK